MNTTTSRGIVTRLMAILMGVISPTIYAQEVEFEDANKAKGSFYNILIAPIAGAAVVSTIEHPSYSSYGISVRPRMNKYFGTVLNFEKYFLSRSDLELKDSQSYPIRDQLITSLGIQGALPLLNVLTLNIEVKVKMSDTDEDNTAIMFGSGFEVNVFPHLYLIGQQNRALYNVNTINLVEGSVIKTYGYRSWYIGLGYAIFE